MALNSTNLWRLCLQRPLVIVIVFALVTCFMFMILQHIAASDNSDDVQNVSHSPELFRRNIDLETFPYHVKEPHAREQSSEVVVVDDLVLRINDLKRIKLSVTNELQSLQREKNKILKEKTLLLAKNEKIVSLINKSKAQLKQYELDISADKRQRQEQSCISSGGLAPIVFSPLKSEDLRSYSFPVYEQENSLENNNNDSSSRGYQFDFEHCKLTQDFLFTVIKTDEQAQSIFDDAIQGHRQLTRAEGACLTVILSKRGNLKNQIPLINGNLLIINLSDQPVDAELDLEIVGRSQIASSSFTQGKFRDRIDIVVPLILRPAHEYNNILGSIPVQSPIDRKYLASYFGSGNAASPSHDSSNVTQSDLIMRLEGVLKTIHRSSIDDMFLFMYQCGPDGDQQCFDEREKMLELSTFHIIIPDEHYDIDQNTNELLYLTLSRGAIPVIVGKERVRLPFDEVVNWRKAALLIPTARLPELHFMLRSLSPTDIYSLKYHGRRIFENHLATSKQVFNTIMSLISLERLQFPPPPMVGVRTVTYFEPSKLNIDTNCTMAACQDGKSDSSMISLLSTETFGPRETPFASPKFRRNLSLALSSSYELWNDPLLSPFHLYPSNPSDPIAPSEFKFYATNQGYRPIGDGLGGSGAEFSQALGGDRPNEQFTIVILTYERVNLLMKTLERLRGLAYLNKILIVWNGINQPPGPNLVWPDVGVPILLIKVERNSLNNRFLPYDAIETDAIFSMDDDSPLRPDEIVFGFRVWRESRDRIVGFPGRFHAWDGQTSSWLYNSNHSCELSMVLTGGAFFHRYYLHAYSQLMPQSIRSIVDKFMNCEDIAMNFLVAHLTRRPPIKVTSRWTFHCANCPTSLSEDDTHFMERHECLNIFASIYGYMPLLNTQHRSDSILFKTRLPRDKQKCFKFV